MQPAGDPVPTEKVPLPLGQARQAVARDDPPSRVPYVSKGHAMHCRAPVASLYVPWGQGVQVGEPVKLAYVPAGQGVH